MTEPVYVCGPRGCHVDLATFDWVAWNRCGALWETRVPGEDAEESWDSGRHAHASLMEAVQAAFPRHAAYGLDVETAARLCLELGLILGTGSELPEAEEIRGCPTCSSKNATFQQLPDTGTSCDLYDVQCPDCGARGTLSHENQDGSESFTPADPHDVEEE